jgi:RNA polymerase sigma-70 factor (ECF subfamily)
VESADISTELDGIQPLPRDSSPAARRSRLAGSDAPSAAARQSEIVAWKAAKLRKAPVLSSMHLMDDDLSLLTQAAARGDRQAVEALVERYLPELRAFVRLQAGALIRARESSSDLVQSVCREVLEHEERFQHPNEGAFKQWLFTTARRKIINRRDYYLAEKRDVLRDVPAEGAGESALFACYKTFSTPSAHAGVREELERVELAFEQLSAEQREVILAAHVSGMSRAQIALQMGKSEGAVRVLLHRALARLSGLLGERDGG